MHLVTRVTTTLIAVLFLMLLGLTAFRADPLILPTLTPTLKPELLNKVRTCTVTLVVGIAVSLLQRSLAVPNLVPVATPTFATGQLVTLSGRLYPMVEDFTGRLYMVYLIDRQGITFELQKPWPPFSSDSFVGEVTTVGYIVSVPQPGTHPYGVIKVESIRRTN